MNRILRVLAVVSLALSACGLEPPATDVAEVAALSSAAASTACKAPGDEPSGPKLEVMTRNLYLGADIFAVTQATTPEGIVAAATEFWVKVQMTDFPARARVIADEILWARPEVLGLQEVTTYRSGYPFVCLQQASPDAPVAEHVELDFLAILQKELHRRGLHYEVAARVTSTDVELCVADPKDPTDQAKFRDLRYTDHEVLLVRKDVKWRNPTLPVPTSAKPGDSNGALFAKDRTAFFDVGGATIYAWRGWTATEVRVGHEWVRVFETHLEDWLDLPPELQLPDWVFQAGQAAELVSILDGSLAMAPLPTVLLGDFNVYVTPEVKPPVYKFLVGGPFPLHPALDGISPLRDAWAALRPNDPGFTWGFDELLRTGALSTTLDLVLATEDLHPLFTYRVGLHDRTRGGLHPSDHAGIVTTFSVR
jgi:hypothetical protein